MQALNPSVISSRLIVSCQLRGDCLSPYKLFFSLQTYGCLFRSSFSKTDRVFNVYLFLHLALKKCCLYIELNHIPVVAGSDGQHNTDTWDATDWSVCTSKVCSGYLRKTLCTESRLEKTVRLDLQHLYRVNNLAPLRRGNQLVNVVFGYAGELPFHRCFATPELALTPWRPCGSLARMRLCTRLVCQGADGR